MTIGFHSPLPPAKSGVADYAAGLLDALRKRGRVVVDARNADVHLYHLGNNQLHREVYERAMERPGVVVLHDAVLHHFYLGALSQAEYVEEFVYNYGEWLRPFAHELWRERAGSGTDGRYFAKPMLRRVGERSLCVIVHNCASFQAVHNASKASQVVEIAHYFDCACPPGEQGRAQWRTTWGIDERVFVFGVFGYLRESKRLHVVLRAFEKLHVLHSHTRLVLAGSFASPDLKKAIEPGLGQPGVIRMGHLGERQFWEVAEAVDGVVNLRNPPAGETSGIGVRLMGLGKPVFYTDGPEIAALPLDSCFRVGAGVEEAAELFEYMRTAVERPAVTRAIGNSAARHIREHHALERIADRYWEILCGVAATSS